ncbi:MAG: hypothetical protein AB7G28_25110 [Pirellulales bacterium]
MLSDISKVGVRCGVFVVGFFDLCGQSNQLRPYVELGSVSEDTKEDIQRDFERIARQLYHFRSDISKYFQAAREESLAGCAPTNALPEQIEMAKVIDSAGVKLQGFSDSVVAYMPLATTRGASLFHVAPLLISVASTMLLAFARGTIVRGAIDATWAIKLFDDEIYGPALLSTYELECQAGWPRVVLGPGIQSLWRMYQNQRDESFMGQMNRTLAKYQSDMAFEDVDGKIAVDYLGQGMQKVLLDSLDMELIDAAQIGLERELHKQMGNPKIEKQLQSTIAYFESRIGPLTDERRRRASEYIDS